VSHWRPDVPPQIEAIVMTALARDPDRRWQRASAMRNALATEIRRQGLGAVSSQLSEWLARSLVRGPAAVDQEPSIVIEIGSGVLGSTPGTQPEVAPEPEPERSTGDSVATKLFRPSKPESVPTLYGTGPAIAPRTTPVPAPVPAPEAALAPLGPWLSAFLVIAISGAVAAVVYFGLLYVT